MSSADLDDSGMTSEDEAVLYVPRCAVQPYCNGKINENLRPACAQTQSVRPAESVQVPMAGGLYIDHTALIPLSEAAGARQLIAPAAPQRLPAQTHRRFGCRLMCPASQVLIEMDLPTGLIERCFSCIQNGSPVEHVSILSKAASRPRSEGMLQLLTPRYPGTPEQALRAFTKASAKARKCRRFMSGEEIKKRPRTQNYEKAKLEVPRSPEKSSRHWRKQVENRAKLLAVLVAEAIQQSTHQQPALLAASVGRWTTNCRRTEHVQTVISPLTHLLCLEHDPQNLSEIMHSIQQACSDEQNECGCLGPNVYYIRGLREYRCPEVRSTSLPAPRLMIYSHCAHLPKQQELVILPNSVTQSLLDEFKETLCSLFLVCVFCVGLLLLLMMTSRWGSWKSMSASHTLTLKTRSCRGCSI